MRWNSIFNSIFNLFSKEYTSIIINAMTLRFMITFSIYTVTIKNGKRRNITYNIQHLTTTFPSQHLTTTFPSQHLTTTFPSQHLTTTFPSQHLTTTFPSQHLITTTILPPLFHLSPTTHTIPRVTSPIHYLPSTHVYLPTSPHSHSPPFGFSFP